MRKFQENEIKKARINSDKYYQKDKDLKENNHLIGYRDEINSGIWGQVNWNEILIDAKFYNLGKKLSINKARN